MKKEAEEEKERQGGRAGKGPIRVRERPSVPGFDASACYDIWQREREYLVLCMLHVLLLKLGSAASISQGDEENI
jgi:hypothetical protein